MVTVVMVTDGHCRHRLLSRATRSQADGRTETLNGKDWKEIRKQFARVVLRIPESIMERIGFGKQVDSKLKVKERKGYK